MKLRITQKDLDNLTLEQKQNLCDLWIPNIYDPAIATVCVDAAEEKFGQITFVIGGIKLLKHHDMLLYDLKFMQDEQIILQEEACSDNIASDRIDGIEDINEIEVDENNEKINQAAEDSEQEFTFDENFNFEFQRPDSFLKQDCVPLLDIGQMIDILERRKFGQGGFHLSAFIDDYYFEIGKDDFSSESILDGNNYELCDVLWESVRALL